MKLLARLTIIHLIKTIFNITDNEFLPTYQESYSNLYSKTSFNTK